MLAKKYRLTGSWFKVISEKKIKFSKNFLLPFAVVKAFETGLDFSLFGVVTPYQFFKKSTEKNKARRKVYEAIRISHLYEQPKKGFIFYLNSKALRLGTEEMAKILTNDLK